MGSEPLPPDCIVDGAIIDGGVVSDVIRQLFTASVQVGGVVTADFTATPAADRVVNFDASASTGTGLTYTWNFGDGDPETVSNATITHVFTDDGPRNVVLTVTDIEGNSASITKIVTPTAP